VPVTVIRTGLNRSTPCGNSITILVEITDEYDLPLPRVNHVI
jgi:hypothetical protein